MLKIGIFVVFILVCIEYINAANVNCEDPRARDFNAKECIENTRCIKFVGENIGCPICECDDHAVWIDDMVASSDQDRAVWHRFYQTDYYYNHIKNQGNAPDGAQSGAGIETDLQLWTVDKDTEGNPLVPYELGAVTEAVRQLFDDAIADFNDNTCIRLVPRTGQENYIRITGENTGCWSNVGRAFTQPNELNLGPDCDSKGVIIHEIMHALGFWHEQSRPDRNDHVKVNIEKVQPGAVSNFDIVPEIDSLGSPYDIQSVMHYFSTIFLKEGETGFTITDLNGNELNTQQAGFAASDITQINALYKCGATTVAPTTQSSTTTTEPTPTTTQPTTTTPTTTQPTTTTPTTTQPTTTSATTTQPTTTTPTTTQPTTTTLTTTQPTTTTPTTTQPTTFSATTTMPTSTTSTAPPTCRNRRSDTTCQNKKNNGLCFYRAWRMKEKCEKTCDLCGCKNKKSKRKCRRARMENGRCFSDFDWALENCRLTCRLCGYDERNTCKDLHPFCDDTYCDEKSLAWSKVYCKKTCNLCNISD
uniref:zinc metalloproteinase nas-14-like n=1 Tax=Styela clava TaxID=7725 RepID=UPI00193967AD|nr:zinc metalloproteinase nas-14-like [Styela clava]